MKLSEAAIKFDEWIWNKQHDPDFKYKNTVLQCEEALRFLTEELGMLPPSATLEKLGLTDNAWEPENEAK